MKRFKVKFLNYLTLTLWLSLIMLKHKNVDWKPFVVGAALISILLTFLPLQFNLT